MVTYVLDSSAILRYLDDEAGATRVAEIIKSHLAGRCAAMIAAPHWGEVAGITCKAHGRDAMELAGENQLLATRPQGHKMHIAQGKGHRELCPRLGRKKPDIAQSAFFHRNLEWAALGSVADKNKNNVRLRLQGRGGIEQRHEIMHAAKVP